MVTLNTQGRLISVKQVIDIQNSPYIVVTSSRQGAQTTNYCLLHCHRGKIYYRDNDSWSSVMDPYYYRETRKSILRALEDENIPKFTTDVLGFNSILN